MAFTYDTNWEWRGSRLGDSSSAHLRGASCPLHYKFLFLGNHQLSFCRFSCQPHCSQQSTHQAGNIASSVFLLQILAAQSSDISKSGSRRKRQPSKNLSNCCESKTSAREMGEANLLGSLVPTEALATFSSLLVTANKYATAELVLLGSMNTYKERRNEY
uniref:Uncharacterized protein n=1 Tax=Micrurus lemniscatus lemniscatus TaxID=129467 RepID=A0A2D4I8U3_MICLE